MATEAELIIDRRRLKRRLTFWRVASIILFIGGLLALASASGGFDFSKRIDHIARVKITGLSTGDQPTLDLLGEAPRQARKRSMRQSARSPRTSRSRP